MRFLLSLFALSFAFAPLVTFAGTPQNGIEACGITNLTSAEMACMTQRLEAQMTECVGNETENQARVRECYNQAMANAGSAVAACRSGITAQQQQCLNGYVQDTLLPSLPVQRASWAGDGAFVPLTQIPGIQDVADSGTLPNFLNTIYQLCIGAAAVLAVLQIMRGGMSYMLGDSVTEKKESKDLIVMSIVGLLIVLSPAIVFGLIDPRILNLQIGFSQLQVPINSSAGNGGTGQNQGGDQGQEGDPSDGDGGPQTPEGDSPCDPETEEEVSLSTGGVECQPISETTETGVGTPQPVQFRINVAEGGKRYIKATYVSGTPAGATSACNLIELHQDYYSLSQCPSSTPSPYRTILPCQEVTGLPKVIAATVPHPRCNQPQFDVQ